MDLLSLAGTLLKVAMIFGLLLVTLRLVGRYGGGGGRPSGGGRPVEVVNRSTLGRNASLVVVRVGEAHYALGVTDRAVTLLAEVGDLPATPAGTPAPAARPSWIGLLDRLRERTVRR